MASKSSKEHPALAAVRASDTVEVKVACSDIDGILRGKYLHRDKFFGAAVGGLRFLRRRLRLGFAGSLLRQHPGHRLATWLPRCAGAHRPGHRAACALGRRRAVLPRGVHQRRRLAVPGLPAPDLEARREARRAADGRHGVRVVQLPGDPTQLGREEGRGPNQPDVRYVRLLAAAHEREPRVLQRADGRDGGLRRAHRGPAHRDRPGRLRGRDHLQRGIRSRRPRDPVQDRRQGDRPALRHHGQLHGQVERPVPGLQRPYPPEPVGRQEKPVLRRQEQALDEQIVRELPGRPGGLPDGIRAVFWPTVNSYKRLVDGFWAPVKPTWGLDNRTASFRVISGSPKATRLETRCPGADVNPYLAMAAAIAAGLHGIEKGLKLTAPPITGANQGANHIPRAPRSLLETTKIFRASDIARDWFGDPFVDHFAATRDWEHRQWQDAVTDWELKRYFEII